MFLGIFFTLFSAQINAQNLDRNEVFQAGESVDFEILYQWGFIWVDAGRVNFSVNEKQVNGEIRSEFVGHGTTLERWDWMYKVRDVYRSVTDTSNDFNPIYFERKVQEGSSYIHNVYDFDSKKKVAYSQTSLKPGVYKKDTISYSSGVADVLSMIYRARLFDYENLKPGSKIPIELLLDNQVHKTHIQYEGTELIKVKDKGKIDCYKFKPLLIEGTIFNAGDEMTVWVSRDKNRVPILVETPILVGSIKAMLLDYKKLKYALEFVED